MNNEFEFDFAQGTEFEKKVMKWMWKEKYSVGEAATDLCKPDIYDVKNNIMYEAKMTRPYYDKWKEKNPDAVDIGTGLPINQFNRYVSMRKHGIKVVLIHKMSEGTFEGKIFMSELTDDLISKVNYSGQNNTVFWKYEDLELIKDLDL
jgi:hypothetical protein